MVFAQRPIGHSHIVECAGFPQFIRHGTSERQRLVVIAQRFLRQTESVISTPNIIQCDSPPTRIIAQLQDLSVRVEHLLHFSQIVVQHSQVVERRRLPCAVFQVTAKLQRQQIILERFGSLAQVTIHSTETIQGNGFAGLILYFAIELHRLGIGIKRLVLLSKIGVHRRYII